MSNLFCDRPHVDTVDFDTSRFVVSTARGLTVDGKHLEMGDAVPMGVLDARALRLEYEPPLRSIDLLEYAMTQPYLCEACAQRGALLGPTSEPQIPSQERVAALKTPANSVPVKPSIRKKR